MSLQRSIFRIFVATALTAASAQVFAQDYYEDDIYYNPSKAKTEKQQSRTKVASKASTTTQRYTYPISQYTSTAVGDYAAADTYDLPVGRTDISVDDYNRNGQFLVADSVASDSLSSNDSFACTRRIERFYNSDIVASSNDEELKDYYYSEDPVTSLNVYVIDPTWGWYGSPWSWRYYSPWHYAYYDPWAWSWGWSAWGWDPFYSWSWGWGGFGWGHAHGWGGDFGHVGIGGGGHWHASTPNAGRTHRSGSLGSSTAMRSRGNSSFSPNGTSRPGNMGRGRYTSSVGTDNSSRGNSLSTSRNSSSSSRSRVSSNSNSNDSRSSRSSYNSNSYNSSSRSSGSSRTHSSGSFGSGSSSRSGGGFGGGSNGGGGGGRGRR